MKKEEGNMGKYVFAAGIVLLFLWSLILSVDAHAQCQDPKSGPGVAVCGDVPGTQYTLNKVNWLLNDAASAVEICDGAGGWANCRKADQLLYDADVAVDQMLRACTPRSSCRNGSLTALCTRTERLGRIARMFENKAGVRRSYDNSLVKIQSWFNTPLCSQLSTPVRSRNRPAWAGNWTGQYSNSKGRRGTVRLQLTGSGQTVTGSYEGRSISSGAASGGQVKWEIRGWLHCRGVRHTMNMSPDYRSATGFYEVFGCIDGNDYRGNVNWTRR